MEKNQAQEALVKFEAEKMSRRAALARVGLRFGAVALAALTVDDLARLAGDELRRRADGNQTVEQVARELQQAGVAFAARTHPWDGGTPGPTNGCGSQTVANYCGYYFCYPEDGGHPNNPVQSCKDCCQGVYGGSPNPGACAGQGGNGNLTLCQQQCESWDDKIGQGGQVANSKCAAVWGMVPHPPPN